MTTKSYICNFINCHENWLELMKEKGIIVKFDDDPNYPLAIFNYSIGADFHDPIVQEARGIIINIDTLEVVCWPFRKFGKYTEDYADKIDWNSARVQEKIDGSIIKLWYHKGKDQWVFSTNGLIYAQDAYCDENHTKTFLDLIKSADNYQTLKKLIDNSKIYQPIVVEEIDPLYKNYTYIFELTSPDNQVVIKHTICKLYHIGTRNNITGREYKYNIGIIKPMEFPIQTLDQCIEAVDFHNINHDTGKIAMCDFEGFVVVDDNWNRIKVKSTIYSILHNILNNGDVSKFKLIELIDKDMIDSDLLADEFPEKSHWIYYYAYKYTEVMYQMQSFLSISRKLYEDNNCDRKIVAQKIKNHKYSSIAFKGLGNDLTVKDILANMTGGYIKSLCKFIPNYQPENFGYLFED